jgi:hypothetical protein
MGYTEGFCQLCGISFNIARIRRPEEPESDAWDCYTRPGSFVTVEWGECAECPNGLCQDVLREGATEKEHLAGPNCRQEYKGYSGSRIGADEMRVGCAVLIFHWFFHPTDLDMGLLVVGGRAGDPPFMALSASRRRTNVFEQPRHDDSSVESHEERHRLDEQAY